MRGVAPGVNPTGACIGPMGQRVRSVMHALNEEKIDIVDFSEDPARFVASALSPAQVKSVEVVDLRTLSPIDWVTLMNSVSRTKRAIVVHEAHLSLGMGSEIAARLHEELFYVMESPVLRVTGYDMPYPPARVEHQYLPGVDRILDAVDKSLAY